MKADFSKTIFDMYFGLSQGLVVVTLHDKTPACRKGAGATAGRELTGKFTGFFRGEQEFDESYIIMWRFVTEEELKEVDFLPYPNQEVGRIIRQDEIANVRFK